ncbi:uncharacterized protein J4E92_001315 [Alternaria infectoria]|uniref:uncharacterized protein n=1 Tax=Alternaria infectoria TaxID=45303 RepID=UPI002220C1FC|nr:uncharacterized protein J4E92_001315 [Alternaria infectoria]KAI4940027.1 hypothetical protein J4E92_001315 [Alternaria infectoria]
MVETFKEGGDMDFQHGFVLKVWCLDDYHSGSILADLVTVMTTLPDFYHLTSKEYDLELRRATESDDDDNGPDDDDNDSDDDDSNHDDNDSNHDDDESDPDDGDSDLDDDEAFSSGSDSDDSSLDIPLIIRPPSYSKKTQTEILQWRPKLWSIPTRAELEAISEFLPPWPTASYRPHLDDDYVPNVYFSAATVAIRFFQRLSSENCQQLRKIVIQEDHPSVASPKIHGQGLLPFCLANPKVRIERRVDVWRTEFVYSSNHFDNHAKGIVMMIGTWINEVKILYQMGMPAECFTLVLHGPSEQASQQLSDAVVRAAIWLEGTVEIARREQRRFLPSEGITEDFVDVIKEMIRGEIPARFDAEMGEVWDIEKILSEHVGDWPSKVSDVFRLQDFDEPDGGWHAAREAYKELV